MASLNCFCSLAPLDLLCICVIWNIRDKSAGSLPSISKFIVKNKKVSRQYQHSVINCIIKMCTSHTGGAE